VSVYSCNNAGTNSKTSPVEKVIIDNKGVIIDYTDSKKGDTVLFFIHGWGINQTYWINQVNTFDKKYRVVTLDLPGFGKSGKNRKDWTVEEYGKDVSAVLTRLNLENVILIGHSMSGAIIVEAALTNPSRVIGVVGVDNLKNYGIVTTPEQEKKIADFFGVARKNYTVTATGYINAALFSPTTDSIVKKRVLSDILNADSLISINVLEQNFKYPLDAKILSLKKCLYLINSSLTPTDTAAYDKNKIAYYLLNIGPTGHYPMLEKPAEFNSLLQMAIDKIKK
jgi:pimeloyl-ACP methyl ester carboxylesterase